MNCEIYRSKKLSQGVARHFKGALSPLEWPVLGFMFGPLLGDQVPKSTTVIVIEPEPLSGILEFGQAKGRRPYRLLPQADLLQHHLKSWIRMQDIKFGINVQKKQVGISFFVCRF